MKAREKFHESDFLPKRAKIAILIVSNVFCSKWLKASKLLDSAEIIENLKYKALNRTKGIFFIFLKYSIAVRKGVSYIIHDNSPPITNHLNGLMQ